MTPLVPDSYLQDRRNQIIEAACKSFTEKGFHKATMQDVCKTAQLSPGAVYNYFSSKEDIVEAAAERNQEQITEIISTAIAENDDDPIGNVLNVFLACAKAQDVRMESLNLELYAESCRNPHIAESVQKSINAVMEKTIELVKQYQEKGLLNNQLDSTAIARVLIALYFGLVVQKTIDSEIDIDAYAKVCEAIIHGKFSA